MIEVLKAWTQKHFSDPQAVMLALFIVFVSVVLFAWGDVLVPVIASVVIAYVLEGLVNRINHFGAPRIVSVLISFGVFVTTVAIMLLGIIPLITKQLAQLIRDFPDILNNAQQLILAIPEKYPVIPESQIKEMLANFNNEIVNLGQTLLSVSLASALDVFTVLVYLIVVPLLVFFIMKDKDEITQWFCRFLPENNGMAHQVWTDVNIKMGNYIRGKMIEILVVGIATYIPLAILGLNYAATLSFFVGLSVVIPYVGAIIITIPVAMIAWFQWGASPDFVYVMSAYLIVQVLDGNILVPLLFSEVVNMHPTAIIIAVLVFGGLWGVWGVFFAIPLATLIQSVINAWPSIQNNGVVASS